MAEPDQVATGHVWSSREPDNYLQPIHRDVFNNKLILTDPMSTLSVLKGMMHYHVHKATVCIFKTQTSKKFNFQMRKIKES